MIDGHDTICNVLEKIRQLTNAENSQSVKSEINSLIDEAKDYAQRMSAKLVEYKREKEGRTDA